MSHLNMPNPCQSPKIRRQSGMNLIELLVAMAIIGITTSLASVYMSSNDSSLRKSLRNLRFDIELAKVEAANRSRTVRIVLPQDDGAIDAFDCNGDGAADGDDACYLILCQNCNDDRYPEIDYSGITHNVLKTVNIDKGINLFLSDIMTFTASGESALVEGQVEIYSAGKETEECPSGCRKTYYPVSINQTGYIDIDDKQQYCESEIYCSGG